MKAAVWTRWLLRIFWSLALICCWHNVNLDFSSGMIWMNPWFALLFCLRGLSLYGRRPPRHAVQTSRNTVASTEQNRTRPRFLVPHESEGKPGEDALLWRLDFRGFVITSPSQSLFKCLQQHGVLMPDVPEKEKGKKKIAQWDGWTHTYSSAVS